MEIKIGGNKKCEVCGNEVGNLDTGCWVCRSVEEIDEEGWIRRKKEVHEDVTKFLKNLQAAQEATKKHNTYFGPLPEYLKEETGVDKLDKLTFSDTASWHHLKTFSEVKPYQIYNVWIQRCINKKLDIWALQKISDKKIYITELYDTNIKMFYLSDEDCSENLFLKYVPECLFFESNERVEEYEILKSNYTDTKNLKTGIYKIQYQIKTDYYENMFWEIQYYDSDSDLFYSYCIEPHIDCWVVNDLRSHIIYISPLNIDNNSSEYIKK